ncbi:MAG: DUF2147 domain-containing protein [Puia sp.]|nr:DUF2147 domain-containing protein [Puia sp.]
MTRLLHLVLFCAGGLAFGTSIARTISLPIARKIHSPVACTAASPFTSTPPSPAAHPIQSSDNPPVKAAGSHQREVSEGDPIGLPIFYSPGTRDDNALSPRQTGAGNTLQTPAGSQRDMPAGEPLPTGSDSIPQTEADSILHVWETREKDGKMQVLKSGNSYYGKMLYGKQLFEADGKTYKKDIHNPDPALRSRELKDYTLISGLVYRDGKWTDGKIYNYQDGNSYDVTIEIEGKVMSMRVYKGVPLFGRTLKWDLVE